MKTKNTLLNVGMSVMLALMSMCFFGFTPKAEAANQVSNINMTPSSPDALHNSDHVDIRFSYTTDEAGGVRIYVLP